MWNNNEGFIPDSFNDVMLKYFELHKEKWGQHDLTFDRFKGSKEYEIYYTAAQVDLYNQGYYAQAFAKLKDFIRRKNLVIQRPPIVPDRIVSRFAELGFVASVNHTTEANKGVLEIAVDYTRTDETDRLIAETIVNQCLAGGIHTAGEVSYSPTISNGQAWPVSWQKAKHRTLNLKYTILKSRNSLDAEIPTTAIRDMALKNFSDMHNLGLDIEPQKYLTLKDLPWAASIAGEYQLDTGEEFLGAVFKTPYDEIFTADINVDDIVITEV